LGVAIGEYRCLKPIAGVGRFLGRLALKANDGGETKVLKLVVLAMMLGCLSLPMASAKSWLCIADKSVGFDEVGKTWQPTTFSTSTKIVIKPVDFSDKDAREVYGVLSRDLSDFEKRWFRSSWNEFGYSFVSGLCDAGLYENVIHCKDSGTEPNETIIVDLKSLRFQRYHPYGYLFHHDDKYRLTQFIDIGTCAEL